MLFLKINFAELALFLQILYLCPMLKAYKYRLNPTKEQKVLINKHIGASRFIYNLALELKTMVWSMRKINLSCFDISKQIPDLKEECPWLKELNSQSIRVPLQHLDNAYTKFFKGQCEFPKFKKKSNKGSFNIPQFVSLKGNKLSIPKFREGIELVLSRPIKGEIRQATISRTPTGKYFVSILCETGEAIPDKKPIREDTTVGVDLGLKTYLVSSDGKEFDNPKYLRKAEAKLKFTQRKYSKHKGKRTKHRLAIAHEKVANQRKDFLHKVSSELIKSHDSIAIEDLAVSNMMQNHSLAKSIGDAGWGMFTSMLEYKAEWYGKNILRIGRFEPSSKLHAGCGYLNKDLLLSDREWTCPKCSEVVSRDLNAAVNIKSFALKNHLSVGRRLKNQGELPTMVGVLSPEAHTVG